MIWFGLIWFYGISTIIGYLMPNPFLLLHKYNVNDKNTSSSNNSV